MEIKNYTSAVNAYRFNAETKLSVKAKKSSNEKTNTDKAEFSAAARAGFADSLKASAKNAAGASASPERLNALSKAINDGTYSVSAEDVAASILGI